MRVLTVGNLFPPHHHGGYELRWAADVDALRARGYEIRVLTSDYRNPAVTAADGTDVHRELRWYRDGLRATVLSLRERVRMERHNAAVLRRHLRDLRPDIVCWWGMGGMSLSLIEQVRREELAAVGVVGDDWMVYASSSAGRPS